jgi:hypothetical protein
LLSNTYSHIFNVRIFVFLVYVIQRLPRHLVLDLVNLLQLLRRLALLRLVVAWVHSVLLPHQLLAVLPDMANHNSPPRDSSPRTEPADSVALGLSQPLQQAVVLVPLVPALQLLSHNRQEPQAVSVRRRNRLP